MVEPFVAPDEDPRSETPSVGERATLIDFLTGCRQTLELKCQGLRAEQMARRSVPPSNMSLLGLVRHMADVERYWFRGVLSGEDAPRRYRTTEDRDADFNNAMADPAVVADAWDAWREEVTTPTSASKDSRISGQRCLFRTRKSGSRYARYFCT